jgi:hypothetical protein
MTPPSSVSRIPIMVDDERPRRVQLSRKKGWRMPANTVSVARPGKWGNRFRVGDDVPGMPGEPMDALDAVHNFQLFQASTLDVTPLRGKNLACWCRLDQPCHADVLLELANKEAGHGR